MSDTNPQLLKRATQLFNSGDVEAAAGVLEQAVTLDPESARGWSDLGTVRFSLGDMSGARDALEEAINVDPNYLDALLNLARLLSNDGSPEDAAPLARRAQAVAPDDPEVDGLVASLGLEHDQHAGALLLDWRRSLRGNRRVFRALLEEHGYRPLTISEDVAGALAKIWKVTLEDALMRIIDGLTPSLVVAESDLELPWDAFEERAIPVLRIGSDGAGALDPSMDEATMIAELPERLADLPPAQTRQPPPLEPAISIIVPTHERADCLRNLLDRLALQDLPPQLFEVIVVDDGSKDPVTSWLAGAAPPFRLDLHWQNNAGPATARNVAIAEARAPLLLILNDDALPALDVVRRHIIAQSRTESPMAVLGTFDFDLNACEDPFTDLMQHSNLLFEYGAMTPGKLHGGRFFWTCNLSIPKASIDAVGGFDEEFRHAICEDCELGFRLEDRGVLVLYDPRIRSWHDHDMSLDRYLQRQRRLGFYQKRLYEKHPRLLKLAFGIETPHLTESMWHGIRARYERDLPMREHRISEAKDLLAQAQQHPTGSAQRRALLDKLTKPISFLSILQDLQGLLDARFGEQIHAPTTTRLADKTTSIIIPNLNGFPHVKGCIQSLREHTPGPWELIIVDNGSTDGSLQWLREQPDVRLLEMGENIGAPAARNAGLQVATGATITFSDNDVLFTPQWRELLIGHLERWPDIGVVGPKSDYVSGSQKTDQRERAGESLADFARRFTEEHAGTHHYSARLILFFMMCRRELIDRIGGIDPIYGRWGFEDDDFCVRARLSGSTLRVADDCFIRHLGSRTSKTANIDYNALLVENFEVFKKKWRLDPSLRYGQRIDMGEVIKRPFDRAQHYVPLSAGIPTTTASN